MFDIDPARIGQTVRGIPILDMKDLRSFLTENELEIAALTIPKTDAQVIVDTLVECGIKGIWNFAHLDLKLPDDVIAVSVHLSESLMELSYRLSEVEKQKSEENK